MSDPRGAECECAACGETFTGLGLFDAHQDVDYSRDPVIICREPAAMHVTSRGHLCGPLAGASLAQNARGVWGTPEGLAKAQRITTTLANARSRKRL